MKYINNISLTLILILLTTQLFAQNSSRITGKIQTQEEVPLDNVNISIEGTDIGTTSNEDGSFSLTNIPSDTYTVIVSSIGYNIVKQKVKIKPNQSVIMDFTLESSTTMLTEILVKGSALSDDKSATTVNVIGLKEIKSLNVEQPLRIIEQVPGVDIQAYRQGGVADQFSIRGFGGGGHEGQAGVEIDGISLNEAEGHADGYADLNVLIPLNLQRMKVYKGPSSVLFGRFAQGGTLAMETRKGGVYQDISVSGGSYNTFDTQYAMGHSTEKVNTNLAFQLMSTDGYSENSETLKGNASARLAYQLSDQTDMAVSLRGHHSNWDAPGYISEEQFNDKDRRDKQDPNGENDGGSKQFYSERIDVNHTFNENYRLLLFGYSVQQDFTRYAKFGLEPGGQTERFNKRNVYAAGGSLNAYSSFSGIDVDWIVGLEYYNENTDRLRWNTENRVRQEQTEDRLYAIQSLSAFAQGEFNINQYFKPTIGLRYDTYFGDFVNQDPGQLGFTQDLNNLSHFSPKVGVSSTLMTGLDLRISASNGFSLPTSTTKYDPESSLDPAILWQYEAGINYMPLEWIELDIATYILNTSNEIVSDPPGSDILINAGSTQRRGIESSASFTPTEGLRIRASYSYTETEITKNTNENQVGKSLVNIPSTIFFGDINYVSPMGLGGRISIRDVGSYYTATDNSDEYNGYTLANLMVFYEIGGRNASRGQIFAEVRNLFNEYYAESVFGSGEKSYAPAPLRNFSIGVRYSFQ